MLVFAQIYILLFLFQGQNNDLIQGTWNGSEAVHVRISELGIDKWFNVAFKIYFKPNGNFRLRTNVFLYNLALKEYKEKNGLNFNSYEIIPSDSITKFNLRLFDKNTSDESIHKLHNIDSENLTLGIVLSNGSEKHLKLKKN